MNTREWMGLAAGAFGIAAALCLFSPSEVQGAKAAGVAGKVSFLKGSAQRGAAEKGPFTALRRNDELREGDLIKTGADARLEIKLADGSLVRLAPNSTLKLGLAKANAEKEGEPAQSKLSTGKMWASVTKAIGGDSRFAVRTSNAVAGVRGTTFRVNAEEDGSTLVKVYEGAVAVSNAPLVEREKSKGVKGPIDFKGRKQVAPPMQEVTLQEWEKIVGKMMSIKVAVDGTQAEPMEFTAQNDAADPTDGEWVAWNQQMDQESGTRTQ